MSNPYTPSYDEVCARLHRAARTIEDLIELDCVMADDLGIEGWGQRNRQKVRETVALLVEDVPYIDLLHSEEEEAA